MKRIFRKVLPILAFIALPAFVNAQSWEVYNSKLELQSRLIYDHIELLSETVKIGHVDGKLFLLSGDLKPAVKIEAAEIYQYLSPWIIVKNENGLGAYHEYGQKNLENEYDEIQTYFNFLLARKGSDFFVFERGNGKITALGNLEDAFITQTGMVITKKDNKFYLPLSKFPTKPYENLSHNESDFLIAKETTGKGLINREGDYILQPVLDQLEHNEGNYFYGYDDNQYLLIRGTEKSGDIRYNSFHEIKREGSLMLEYIHGKLRRVMAEDGILLDTVGLEKVTLFEDKLYNITLRDGKHGLLGENGWIVKPLGDADQIYDGQGNFYPARNNGKMGVVNSSGDWQIKAEFDSLRFVSENRLSYGDKGAFGLMDISGKIISAPNYSKIGEFKKGVSIVEKSGAKTLIDNEGNDLTAVEFDEILRLENDLFIVEKDGKTGLIDLQGNQLLAVEFDAIQSGSSVGLLVTKDDLVGMSTLKGEIVFPIAYEEIILDTENDQILLKNKYIPVIVTEPETSKKRKRKGA